SDAAVVVGGVAACVARAGGSVAVLRHPGGPRHHRRGSGNPDIPCLVGTRAPMAFQGCRSWPILICPTINASSPCQLRVATFHKMANGNRRAGVTLYTRENSLKVSFSTIAPTYKRPDNRSNPG